MNIQDCNRLIDRGPVIINPNDFRILMLDFDDVALSSHVFDIDIDKSDVLISEKRIVIKDEGGRLSRRIPRLNPTFEIENPNQINHCLCAKYDQAIKLFKRQSEIPDIVLDRPEYETIILLICDGLSYDNVKDFPNCSPMIVDGATITSCGMKRIVGNPTIAQKMYNKNKKLYGYSFWSRDEEEEITKRIFSPLNQEDLLVYKNFEEVISDMKNKDIENSYIQIVTSGLDTICHKSYDEPPIESYIQKIVNKIQSLEHILIEKGVTGTIFITSDHGILWEKEHELEPHNMTNATFNSARITKGRLNHSNIIYVKEENKNYSMLKYPYIGRKIKKNEWGVHGGVSYQESIVPFIHRTVN